jgi:hypothetical protein
VQPGQTLSYTGAVLSELADVFAYSYQPNQPYINQAVGYVLWPSIVLAPNATVGTLASWLQPIRLLLLSLAAVGGTKPGCRLLLQVLLHCQRTHRMCWHCTMGPPC